MATTDKNIRLQNAEKIIWILIEMQKGCKAGEVSDDLQYTVERLIKGISSYRDAARQGFSVTLTFLLLKKFPVISLTQMLEYLEKYQPIAGSKAEKGQTFIGRALAYEAIVLSNRLKNEASLLTSLVQTLFEIASKRSYVQVAVINILNDLLREIAPENFETFVKPAIEDKLTVGWQNCTPQDLWLILTCQKCFGSIIDHECVLEYWGYNPIINQDTYNDVANVLKQTVITVYPVLHPLWKEIVNNVYKSECFNEFWKTAVGENLMEKNQFERTFLIFELIKMLMSVDITVDKLKTILSANLLTLVMKSVKINHHPLFSASKQLVLEFLVNSVKESKDSSKQLVILNALLLPPGTLLTDNETRTKYLYGIVRNLFPESLVEYGSILEKTFKNDMEYQLAKTRHGASLLLILDHIFHVTKKVAPAIAYWSCKSQGCKATTNNVPEFRVYEKCLGGVKNEEGVILCGEPAVIMAPEGFAIPAAEAAAEVDGNIHPQPATS